MGLFRSGKPNVKAAARRGDVDALVAAVGYQNLMPGPDGRAVDGGVAVRREAILALGEMGPEVGAEAVTAALSDHSDHVRVAAIHVLYARGQATPLAAALTWLPRNHGHSRPLAMRALAELRQPDSAPGLTAALVLARGDDPIDEDDATLLILLLQADEGSDIAAEVVEQLLVALADEDETVSGRAEDLLALIAPTSIEGLIAELKAGAAPHRAAAALARIKDTRALEPLMEGLRHRDASVRAESARALGELRDPAAVEALIHATRDPHHEVRARAGSALDKLGMVALVVGVSTLVRPILLEAVADVARRPAIPEHATGAAGETSANGTAAREGDAEAAAQAPAADNETAPRKPRRARSRSKPDGPAKPRNGSGADARKASANGSAPGPPAEPATADLLERLVAPDDGSKSTRPQS
jgi:HEAT repeat protein